MLASAIVLEFLCFPRKLVPALFLIFLFTRGEKKAFKVHEIKRKWDPLKRKVISEMWSVMN